jgi:hypothetical protein
MPDDPATERPRQAIPLLERREIEARIVGPLVRAFAEAFGDGPTRDVLRRVISDLARQAGDDLACQCGQTGLDAFASTLERWKAGGALELTILEQSDDRLAFNVTRCRYAEMYRALGLADLGPILSCLRDFALVEGFNPDIGLTRTQTLMEGASHCDFRFERRGEPIPGSSPGGPAADQDG